MKLIFVDIDGTLLDSDNNITDKTRDSLIKAQEEGHTVVISSGRDPNGIRPYAEILKLEKYGGLVSAFNGGMIINQKTKEVLIDHRLDLDLAKEILSFAKNLDADYLIYEKDLILTNSEDAYNLKETAERVNMDYKVIGDLDQSLDFPPHKILFTNDPKYIEKDGKKLEEKFGDLTDQVKSTPCFYEIMPKGIDKGKSLVEIGSYLDFDIKDTLAFGDEENDLAMIKNAGTGVVMGNSRKEIQELADYVTKSNDDDGIAFYLEKFILNK